MWNDLDALRGGGLGRFFATGNADQRVVAGRELEARKVEEGKAGIQPGEEGGG